MMPDRRLGYEEDVRKAAGEPSLTGREREVLTLIASGKSTKEIATILGMALPTAVTHRYHLQQKLDARNTAELTRAAVRLGLINL